VTQDKLVNVRRLGRCFKCLNVREVRVAFNDTMSEIVSLCDQCFQCPPLDDESFDLIFEKAGVSGPMRTLSIPVADFIQRLPPACWDIERIFPED
jgi:hypothetical protein